MGDPVLRIGSQGDAVRTLQTLLANLGFNTGGMDGSFGPHTDAEVRSFQGSRHLGVDGVVGPMTWGALRQGATPPPPPPPPSPPPGQVWALSDQGTQFIANFEGFRGNLYNDANGNCTIGYGHLVHTGPVNGSEPPEFIGGISQARALAILKEDAPSAAATVNKGAPGLRTQQQFDALVSFCFNIGSGGFSRSSVCQLVVSGQLAKVPDDLAAWKRPGAQVLTGLLRRRAAEAALFRDGTYA